MTVRSILNYQPGLGEINDQPSNTIPDQTLSIKEILNRYARGLPIGGQKFPIYEGEDNDLPDPRHLDLAERDELAQRYAEEMLELRRKHAQQPAQPVQGAEPNPTGQMAPAALS